MRRRTVFQAALVGVSAGVLGACSSKGKDPKGGSSDGGGYGSSDGGGKGYSSVSELNSDGDLKGEEYKQVLEDTAKYYNVDKVVRVQGYDSLMASDGGGSDGGGSGDEEAESQCLIYKEDKGSTLV